MRKISVIQICALGFSAALNVLGGSIALFLHLPLYLDSCGTVLSAALMGPFYGMLPGIISGVLQGCTSDVYAFYYIPVQMIIAVMTGLVFSGKRQNTKNIRQILVAAAMISIPGTFVSAGITAVVFGGITSSGSTIIVQLLHGAGLELSTSVFVTQALTDYLDRVAVLYCVAGMLKIIPYSLKEKLQRRQFHGTL